MLRKTTHGLLAARALLVAMPAGAQTLRFGLAEDPDALDPALGRTFVGRIVFSALCDKLVDISPDLKVVPQLATAWSWSADNKALRSEEHTSELQSLMRLSYAVFCLKKKKKRKA